MTIGFFRRRNRFKIRQLREVRKSEKMAEEMEMQGLGFRAWGLGL